MDVEEWIEGLESLVDSAWLTRESPLYADAREILLGMASGDLQLPHRFEPEMRECLVEKRADRAGERGVAGPREGTCKVVLQCKPEAAREAQQRRDAAIRVALAIELQDCVRRHPAGPRPVHDLARALVDSAFTAPTGLRPRSTTKSQGDFAHDPGAPLFFETRVASCLHALDKLWGVDLVERAGAPYDIADPDSIERWGRTWTACAALQPLRWAIAQGCASLEAVACVFMAHRQSKSEGLPGFRLVGGVLPTARHFLRHPTRLIDSTGKSAWVKVRAELKTSAFLAQILECEPWRWRESADAVQSLHIPLAALDDVPGSRSGGHTAHYRGRDILQIYLVVLTQCLRASNRRHRDMEPDHG